MFKYEPENIEFIIELANDIDPENSLKNEATTKKIELKLKKVLERTNWMSVEKGG
jgi:hypothetical protein